MATIPRFRAQLQGGGLEVARQSPEAPVGAFGGDTTQPLIQASQQIEALSNKMLRVAAQQNDKKNAAWAAENMARFTEFGDTDAFDPTNGVFNRKLGDAVGITKDAKERYDKQMLDMIASAPTPDAGEIFKQKATAFRVDQMRMYARHESKQIEEYGVNSVKDQANTATASWTQRWSASPEEYNQFFDNQVLPALTDLAAKTGAPVESLIRDRKAVGYAAMIKQNIAVGATAKAESLMAQWDKDLNPDDRTTISSALRTKQIAIEADNTSMALFDQIRAGKITETQAGERIRGIEDIEVKSRVRSLFGGLLSDHKREQRELQFDHTTAAFNNVDKLEGQLAKQYDYVQSLPSGSAAERKAKVAAENRYKQYASAAGLSFQTSPVDYEKLTDGILYGNITDKQGLHISPEASRVSAKDLKVLEGFIDKKQSLKLTKQTFEAVMGSKYNNKEWHEFMGFAMPKIKETNRGDDPEFVNKLVDTWFMSGETKSMFAPGYGKDKTFGKTTPAVKGQKVEYGADWLPDIPTNVGPQIRAVFDSNPDYASQWLKKYNGDEALAQRAYYKQVILNEELGKRRK